MRGRKFRVLVWGVPAMTAVAFAVAWTWAGEACVAPYRLRPHPAISTETEISAYEERLRRNPEGALDLAALASAHLRARRYDVAEEKARESLKRLPVFNLPAKAVLAQAAQARHRFEECIKWCGEILRERPRQPDAMSLLVTANLATGRVQEAARWADELVERLPSVGSYSQLALALEATGREREAEHAFKKAIALEDVGEMEASSRARTWWARFLLRRGRPEVARGLLVEAIRIHPENAMAHGLLAQVEEHQVDASRHLSEAYRLSGDATWLVRKARLANDKALLESALPLLDHSRPRAEALLELGRKEEALALLEVEVKTRRDWETLRALGRAYAACGRPQEALKVAREALRTGIRDSELYALAAQVEASLGHKAEASFIRSLP